MVPDAVDSLKPRDFVRLTSDDSRDVHKVVNLASDRSRARVYGEGQRGDAAHYL